MADKTPASADCPVCKRAVRIYIPRGGGGSMLTYVRHRFRGPRYKLAYTCPKSHTEADPADWRTK